MSYELLGWVGGILLAVCAAPQAYLSLKQGHSNGVALGMLMLWLFGEIFTLAYVLPKMDWPLIVNYVANIVFIGVICWYRFYPRVKIEDAQVT